MPDVLRLDLQLVEDAQALVHQLQAQRDFVDLTWLESL